MGGKFLGPDVIALSVPIVAVSCLFFGMIGRAFILDPDWSKTGTEWYEKDEASQYGQAYRMQYQQIFRDRVIRGARSLFDNEPTPEKKP